MSVASRLMASAGSEIAFDLLGLGRVEGVLSRVGESWCLISASGQDWVIPLRHVLTVHGASDRSVPEVAWSPVDRLGLRAALRRVADAGARCVVHLVDGTRQEAYVERVGADFLECRAAADPSGDDLLLVPYDAVVAVQSRDRVGQVASTS